MERAHRRRPRRGLRRDDAPGRPVPAAGADRAGRLPARRRGADRGAGRGRRDVLSRAEEPSAEPLDDEDVSRYGMVRLTPLGVYGVRARMLEAGVDAPAVGDLADKGADVLLDALARLPRGRRPGRDRAVARRAVTPLDAARELLAAARGDDERRPAAPAALPAGPVAGRRRRPSPRCARCSTTGAGRAGPGLARRARRCPDVPAPSEDDGLLADRRHHRRAAGAPTRTTPSELRDLVQGLAEQHSGFFDAAWRVDHPAHRGRPGGDGPAAPGQEGRQGGPQGRVQGAVAAVAAERARGRGRRRIAYARAPVRRTRTAPGFRCRRTGANCCPGCRAAFNWRSTTHESVCAAAHRRAAHRPLQEMTMPLTRRDFAKRSALTGAGSRWPAASARSPPRPAPSRRRRHRTRGRDGATDGHGELGYGPLRPRPGRHPRAARRVLVPRSSPTAGSPSWSRGESTPSNHDGTATFEGPRGATLLVNNHELKGPRADWPHPVPLTEGLVYDPAAAGGCTVVEVRRGRHRSPSGSASPAPPPTARAAAPLGAPGSPARRPRTRPARTA